MRASIAGAWVLAVCAVAAAQSDEWRIEAHAIGSRSELCSSTRTRPTGRCDVDATVRAGTWTATIVHPHTPGTFLGAPSLRWDIDFANGRHHFGALLHTQGTVCTDDHHEHIGGYGPIVIEALVAQDVCSGSQPEVILRWRDSPGGAIAVQVCSLEGAVPRCTTTHPDGPIARASDGFTIGAVRVPAP